MKTITKTLLDHNEAQEDHKTIYREITTLETAMGSTVLGAVSKAVGELRRELKKIFEALSEGTPRPKTQTHAHRGRSEMIRRREVDSSDPETDPEVKPRRVVAGVGLKGTIGGRRGGSGAENDPIVLDTPAPSATKESWSWS